MPRRRRGGPPPGLARALATALWCCLACAGPLLQPARAAAAAAAAAVPGGGARLIADRAVACAGAEKAVIYKLDDVTGLGGTRWLPLFRWSVASGHAVSAGVIGGAYAQLTNRDRARVRGLAASGLVEFWNHGYRHNYEEFHGAKIEDMVSSLRKTNEVLAADGIFLRAFGAPGGRGDALTAAALGAVPELRAWMLARGLVRLAAAANVTLLALSAPPCWLEKAPGVMRRPEETVAACASHYEARGGPLVLNAHPKRFSRESMRRFKAVVEGLAERGFVSCTPSQYLGLA